MDATVATKFVVDLCRLVPLLRAEAALVCECTIDSEDAGIVAAAEAASNGYADVDAWVEEEEEEEEEPTEATAEYDKTVVSERTGGHA
jgi:hypothetical protein